MDPVIFQIGPIAIRWYGVMLAATILLGIAATYRYGPRFGISTAIVDRVAVALPLVLLIGARLGFVLAHPSFFREPLEILRIDRGGLASHGAIAAGFVYALWAARRYGISVWSVADAVGWAIPIGNILVRFGNFANGELYGNPTTLPWGVRFPGAGELPRHPLQIYEMLLAVPILLLANKVAGNRRFEGQVWWTIVLPTSIGRVLLDALRADARAFGVFTLGQIPALVLIVWGTLALVRGARRARAAQPGQAASAHQ